MKKHMLMVGVTVFAMGLGGLMPVSADHHGMNAVKAAINSPSRPAEDKTRDANRRPAEVLEFAGVKPGMTVLDINASEGYYTELLSRVVGEHGKVYSHNGPVYWDFMKKAEPERFHDGRLPNVVQLQGQSERFNLPEGSVDVALGVLEYHDYYFTHPARIGGAHEDIPPVLASLYHALKPGGSVVIVDHVAPAGTGPDDFDKMHRIDPEVVKAEMKAAGFKLVAESDVLKNPHDDLMKSPFDKSIRGKTSRFVMRFEK